MLKFKINNIMEMRQAKSFLKDIKMATPLHLGKYVMISSNPNTLNHTDNKTRFDQSEYIEINVDKLSNYQGQFLNERSKPKTNSKRYNTTYQ